MEARDIRRTEEMPPMLPKEQAIADKMGRETNMSILFGGITGHILGSRNSSLQKFVQRFGRLGQANIIMAGGLSGLFVWHRIRYNQLTQQFPDGYYKRVLYEGMTRDLPTKSKYFAEHPEELRLREAVIGIYRVDDVQKPTVPSGSLPSVNRPYTTYAELRRKYEQKLTSDPASNEYSFEKPK